MSIKQWNNSDMDPIASCHENEVHGPLKVNIQAPQPELMNPAVETEYEDDEFWPLSGKPYFNVVLAKSHVKRGCTLFLPVKLLHLLPNATVPAIVRCCRKNWEIMFCGEGRSKWFSGGWKEFVVDNDLKIGDALVFELMDSSIENLKFRVQILRGDFPAELQEKVRGTSVENAIHID